MGKKSRLFFVTDIHGSDRCFRKFINAAKFYKAQFLVLGGDITGKVMIPIIDTGRGKWAADYLGEQKEFSKIEGVEQFEKSLGDSGLYSLVVTRKEYEELEKHKEKIDAAFNQAMRNSLERWLQLAEDRLKGSGVKCFISVGNDDDMVVDDVLSQVHSESIEFCEEKNVFVDGHEMLSFGTSNRTPWNSPREADEDEINLAALAAKI